MKKHYLKEESENSDLVFVILEGDAATSIKGMEDFWNSLGHTFFKASKSLKIFKTKGGNYGMGKSVPKDALDVTTSDDPLNQIVTDEGWVTPVVDEPNGNPTSPTL